MDSVRFGRSLGFGARSAAKALAGAVDAATSPPPVGRKEGNSARTPPSPPAPQAAEAAPSAPPPRVFSASDPVQDAARAAARATVQAREAGKGVARGSKQFGRSVWRPLAKLSGVLWLEITGAFFGLFALFAGQSVWTHRADFRPTLSNHEAHVHALVFLGMTAVFAYFCISSFVRANRR